MTKREHIKFWLIISYSIFYLLHFAWYGFIYFAILSFLGGTTIQVTETWRQGKKSRMNMAYGALITLILAAIAVLIVK